MNTYDEDNYKIIFIGLHPFYITVVVILFILLNLL